MYEFINSFLRSSVIQRSSPNDYLSAGSAACSNNPDGNYVSIDRTRIQSVIYDNYEVECTAFENKQFDDESEKNMYENLKAKTSDNM